MEFLTQSMETTIFKLEYKIADAKKRLMFLLDYSEMPAEDIKLNSTVFFWPELVMQILDKNQVRLQALREKTEDKLKDRLVKYDEKLKELLKRVEAYKTIGVSISDIQFDWQIYFLVYIFTICAAEFNKIRSTCHKIN